jgi:hypothetical protein
MIVLNVILRLITNIKPKQWEKKVGTLAVANKQLPGKLILEEFF